MAITQRRLTFEEFLALPEEKPALEYLDGAVSRKMSPKGRHGRLQFALGSIIDRAAGDPPAYWVLTELRVNWAGEASFVPDLAVYRVERLPWDPSGEVADDFFIPPDVAIEVASPGQSERELLDRARWFLEHGVAAVAIVQPRIRGVRVVRADADSGWLRGGDTVDLTAELPGCSFGVAELFATIERPKP
jgi:Uma2 family endonuclease